MFYNSRAFTFTQSVNVLPLTSSVTADRIGCPCVIYLSGVLKKKSRVHVKSVYRPSPLGKIAGGHGRLSAYSRQWIFEYVSR